MAQTHQRVISFILAMLFLATTVATGAIVVWQVRQDNKAKQQDSTAQTDNNNPNNTLDTSNQEENKNMLKGTALANYTPVAEATSLQKIDLVEGTGDVVQPGATVTVHYTGAYAVNGIIFESSKDGGKPITFPLSGVIPGWTEGVPGMKVGGTRRLIIPGDKAYGLAPAGYTPGSTARPMGTLVFDIELVSIGQ